MGNAFRIPMGWGLHNEGKLDRQYLRTCATYKLLKDGRIDRGRAVELLLEKRIGNAEQVVSLWVSSPWLTMTTWGQIDALK